MGFVLDENGIITKLTQKEKLFCDEYCTSGNAYRSYLKIFNVKENTKRPTVERRIARLLRKSQVSDYIEKKQKEVSEKLIINAQYSIQALVDVVENNRGKKASVRPAELLGKINGLWWTKPSSKIDEDIPFSDNTESIHKVLYLLKDGKITEESATTWIQLLNQKSNVNEREITNKEIIEKLDNLKCMMNDKE